MNELELINSCRSGSNAARQKLYEIYSRQMMGICYRYTGNKMVSQDLLHDGFIKVFVSFNSFNYRGEGSLKAWISRIFVNTALEYLRKSEMERESASIEEWKETGSEPEEKDYERIPDQVLMSFIAELPEGYRAVFNMYTFEDMSHKEIGESLEINESSSRSQLSRAKTILAKRIQDYIRINEG